MSRRYDRSPPRYESRGYGGGGGARDYNDRGGYSESRSGGGYGGGGGSYGGGDRGGYGDRSGYGDRGYGGGDRDREVRSGGYERRDYGGRRDSPPRRREGGEKQGPPDISNMTSLKVDNLSYRTKADMLKPLFSKYGEIGDIYIPRNFRTQESRGFAFVRFFDRRDAEEAMDRLDGSRIDGREIRVSKALHARPDGATNPRARSPHAQPRGRSRSRSYGRDFDRSRSRSPR